MTTWFTVLRDREDESFDRADGEFGKEGVLRGKIMSPVLVSLN